MMTSTQMNLSPVPQNRIESEFNYIHPLYQVNLFLND